MTTAGNTPPTTPAVSPGLGSGGAKIVHDRPCVNCGYNLIGLAVGGRCPECGTAIRAKRSSRMSDNLTDAPREYLTQVTIGSWLLVGAIVVVVVAVLALPSNLALSGDGASGLLWGLGVWLVTRKRPLNEDISRDPLLESRHLRWAARAGTFLGPGALVLETAASHTGYMVFDVFSTIASTLAFLAMAPLCVYLSAMADWSGDTGLGGRFRGCAWVIGVLGPLAMICVGIVSILKTNALLIGLVAVLLTVALLIALLVAIFSVVQLAITAAWAVQNAETAREREIRIANKRAEEAERMAAGSAPSRPSEDDPAIAPIDLTSGRPRHPEADDDEAIPLAGGGPDEADDIDRRIDEVSPVRRPSGGASAGASKIRHTPNSIGRGPVPPPERKPPPENT